MAVLSGGALMLAGFQLAVGMLFLHLDRSASQRYCESLAAELDEIYTVAGQYPLSLSDEQLRGVPSLGLMGQRLVYYSSEGSSFEFEVSNPAEIFGGFRYSSADRRWVEWRD